MPVSERTQSKERFACWLLRQINNKSFDGVCWLGEGRTIFRLPWKHFNMKNVNEKDYGIFKAWAIHSGKYNPQCVDPPTWKTNFRCALNGVVYRDIKMFSEVEDHSSDQHDPHKKYRFNGVHNDFQASSPTAAANSVYLTNPAEQNLRYEIEEDEDYTLRISPACVGVGPFVHNQESEAVAELLKNILLDPSESGIQQVLQLSQDEYTQDAPFVDHVFTRPTNEQCPNSGLEKPCVINGYEQGVPEEGAFHIPVLHEQHSQYQGCNTYANAYQQNASAVEQVSQQLSALSQVQSALPVHNGFGTPVQEIQACQLNGFYQQSSQDAMYNNLQNGCPQDVAGMDLAHSYRTPTQECAISSQVCHIPPVINGHGLTPAQEAHANLLHQQRTIPRLTSWEVTIFYRGTEVLKQSVSNKFVITQDVGDHQLESTDIVRLPATDVLVNQLQIDYTNKILRSVGNGLSLEVNPVDHKLYAKRMGLSRVYWSMSERVETKETASQAKMLTRDVQTEIFDFKQFWEDLKGYKHHKRLSPDYTIYVSFGQILFKPVAKELVLVKLVPNFCTFWHQTAQREGASSLHTELVSLQISNGSSFNSYDLDGPCLMDLDFSCLY